MVQKTLQERESNNNNNNQRMKQNNINNDNSVSVQCLDFFQGNNAIKTENQIQSRTRSLE